MDSNREYLREIIITMTKNGCGWRLKNPNRSGKIKKLASPIAIRTNKVSTRQLNLNELIKLIPSL
jgi:hypothetical protein